MEFIKILPNLEKEIYIFYEDKMESFHYFQHEDDGTTLDTYLMYWNVKNVLPNLTKEDFIKDYESIMYAIVNEAKGLLLNRLLPSTIYGVGYWENAVVKKFEGVKRNIMIGEIS